MYRNLLQNALKGRLEYITGSKNERYIQDWHCYNYKKEKNVTNLFYDWTMKFMKVVIFMQKNERTET